MRRRRRAPLVGRDPVLDGPPTRRPRSGGFLALVAVLAVVLAVWAISGGDPGTATRGGGYADSGTGTEAVTPTPAPTTTPTTTPTIDPTTPPSPMATEGADGTGATGATDVPVVPLRDAPAVARTALQHVGVDGASSGTYRDWSFANGRGLLPAEPEGYYRAYAVPLPGSSGIGHLVVGERHELFWTEDVGRSFVGLDC